MKSIDGMKVCSKCRLNLPVEAFNRARNQKPDGLHAYCKSCCSVHPARYLEEADNRKLGLLKCCVCKQWMHPSCFGPDPSRKTGKNNRCRGCHRTYTASWQRQNPEKVHEGHVRDWQRNKERHHERHAAWLKTPAGRASSAQRGERRRERMAAAPCDLTAEEWLQIIADQEGRCAACARPFGPDMGAVRDHIVPVIHGGGLTKENIQALCRSCNSRKRSRIIDYRKKANGPGT